MIYLDNNATTRPSAGVVEAVRGGLEEFWQNPSSVHRAGQGARARVELAREALAGLVGARPREVTLVSGGTEAVDLAVRGVLEKVSRPVLVTTRVEHAAVRELAEGLGLSGTDETRDPSRSDGPPKAGLLGANQPRDECEGVRSQTPMPNPPPGPLPRGGGVRWLPLGEGGVVDVLRAAEVLHGATLVSVQWANNETGVVQPVREIARLARAAGAMVHVDATQWVGKMPASVADGWCDLLTFSAHKFHGPKGVGVLWARSGVGVRPRIVGTQEMGRRGGTENVPGILGAGVAAQEAVAWLKDDAERTRLAGLRDWFEREVMAGCEGVVRTAVNGGGVERLWNTTNIGFEGLEAEALLMLLSERGVCASAGAACSSGSLEPSPVLLAMGVPEAFAHGSVRFSLSRETTQAEVREAVGVVVACVKRLAKA